MVTLSVEEFLSESQQSNTLSIFDVRSPAEYARGTIPGAASLPLFDDAERELVGIAYHTEGRTAAIKRGLELVGPKLRWMVEQVETRLLPGQVVGLYCWRGGMRSAAVAWLLEFYGFQVVLLRGGYKAFRRFALAQFEARRTLYLLSGCTGAGKTAVLSLLATRGEATIDLEALACHRGSAFGALGLPPQPTQQNFENALAVALWKNRAAERIWIEDESRRIGTLTIPDGLWQQMLSAPIIALDVPLDRRIEYLVQEYGSFPPCELAQCLEAIRQRLGAERYARACAALKEGDLPSVAQIALEHYDKAYRHSLRKRAERVRWVEAQSPEDAASKLCILNAQLDRSHNPVSLA
jgi:tRNA 2-selenouridine synthase